MPKLTEVNQVIYDNPYTKSFHLEQIYLDFDSIQYARKGLICPNHTFIQLSTATLTIDMPVEYVVTITRS